MSFLNFIIDFLFPTKCMFCNTVTPHGKGEYICGSCREKVEFCKDSNCCKICGKPQVSLGEKGACYQCLTKTYRPYKRAAAVVKYDKLTSSGVKRFKDGYGEIIGKVMAEKMAGRIRTEFDGIEFDIITGVAPGNKRTVKRGFEPVAVLCKYLSKYTKIPYSKGVLLKIKDTPKQSSLNYEKRTRNLIGSIGLAPKADVKGKTVLLVDDVMTTGSTIEECAYVLKQGGAKTVYAVTFATTTKEPKTYVNK